MVISVYWNYLTGKSAYVHVMHVVHVIHFLSGGNEEYVDGSDAPQFLGRAIEKVTG